MSKNKEGYFLVDHRDSPGMTEEQTHRAGMPVGAGHGVFEAATYTCPHCSTVVIINPLRTRKREWCWSCDKYICDKCAATMAAIGKCVSMDRLADEIQNGKSPSLVLGASNG